MIIHPNNPKSKELEIKFNNTHSKHAIQTIAWNEITKEYKCVRDLDSNNNY